jgi:membrane protein
MRFLRTSWQVIRATFGEWSHARASRLGAALSYYTVFSLAPVLLVITAVAGLFLGADAAQGRLTQELNDLLGPQAGGVVQSMLAKASERKGGIIATIVGLATLLAGSTGVMLELQSALNTVWQVTPKPGRGLKGVVKDRTIGLALLISLGFLLIVSLAASAALGAFGHVLDSFLPGAVLLGTIINLAFSLTMIAGFFALLLKVLPDAEVAWRDVWIGAVVTSALFHIGKVGIGLYLGHASVSSAFGAAGSLAVLLVWVYYSSQIVLFGAAFTRVYAERFGSHVVPDKDAVPAPSEPQERIAVQQELEGKPPQSPKRGRDDGQTDPTHGERGAAQARS